MIHSRLKQLLDDKGWSLYRARQESGVSYPTLLALRDNRTKMFRADVLDKLCRTFECQIGELLMFCPPRAHNRKRKPDS